MTVRDPRPTRGPRRGPVAVCLLVLALGVLTGCGGSGADPSGGTSSNASTAAGTAAEERLREALAAEGSPVRELLDDPATTVTERTSPFPRWSLLDVEHLGPNHPSGWTFAVSDDGDPRAINLAARPTDWGQVIDGLRVTSQDEALALAATYVELTHAPEEAVYVVKDVDEIRWLPAHSEHAKKAVATDRRRVRGQPHPARITGSEDGWVVTLTAMHQDRLVTHELSVGEDGSVAEQTRDLETGLATTVVR